LARRTRRTRCCRAFYGTGLAQQGSSSTRNSCRLEEAAKRDHRKIGQEMDLFHLQAEAHGSVFWHRNGYRHVAPASKAYLRRRLDAAGYREVKTPQLMDSRQWEAVRPTGASIARTCRRPRRGARARGRCPDPVRRGST
jgi:threonyl-tRNA synthetase